jgi:RNA polymerase sigma-70 factor (ECF subfamily)
MPAERESSCLTTTVTSTDLLEGLRAPENRTVWQQFVDRYQPMIANYARHGFRLSLDDAEEAAQATLIAFAEAYQRGRYDREKGQLRKWLFGIATNQIQNVLRKKARNREVQLDGSSGVDVLGQVPDENRLEAQWEEDWRRAVYRQCLAEVRAQFDPRTVEAFVQYGQQGRPAEEVAEALSMTRNAVFVSKHRILKRIRELVPLMEAAW